MRHAILSSDSDFQSELLRQANDFFDLTLYKRITFMKQFNAIIIIVPKIFNVCFTAIGTFAENCKNPGHKCVNHEHFKNFATKKHNRLVFSQNSLNILGGHS